MTTAARHGFDCSRLRLTAPQWRKACIAGSLWGVTLTVGLAAMSAWQCGGVCLPELAVNLGLSTTAGILGIGPIVACNSRR
jgi:hypothetical protein